MLVIEVMLEDEVELWTDISSDRETVLGIEVILDDGIELRIEVWLENDDVEDDKLAGTSVAE